VNGVGPTLHVGEASRVGARADDSSLASCSVSLPLPLRSGLPRMSERGGGGWGLVSTGGRQ
jgi:hypothetical protein